MRPKGRFSLPWDSIDRWRDEDETEAFWKRAGANDAITPEVRARIESAKANRTADAETQERKERGGKTLSARRQLESATLTNRELEILALIALGLSNGEIGRLLFLSPETAKTHVRNMLAKLKARNRAHAVALAYQQHILATDA